MIKTVEHQTNETGVSETPGLRVVPAADADDLLTNLAGHDMSLPSSAVMTSGPESCPACGARSVMWGCDPEQSLSRGEIHPLVWHETEWMADTFICRTCDAGWIQPDGPGQITWVRPYWRVA
jgi:hypothetical protein